MSEYVKLHEALAHMEDGGICEGENQNGEKFFFRIIDGCFHMRKGFCYEQCPRDFGHIDALKLIKWKNTQGEKHKVVIEITACEDGDVSLKADFYPPIDRSKRSMSQIQTLGVMALQYLKGLDDEG